MPDTERLITEWRRTMTAHFAGREELLEELEGHLRDAIEELVEAGTTLDGAFLVAAARLGLPNEIAVEFAKVPPLTSPWLPIRLVWVASVVLLVCMVWPLTPKLTAGGTNTLLAVHRGLVMLGYVATLFVGLLAAAFLLTRLFHDLKDGQKESLKRAILLLSGLAAALTGVGVVLGGWCPYEKRGWCFGLDTHEVGGGIILTWNVVMLACCWRRRRTGTVAVLTHLGIVGNIVVILGWLGAAVVEQHAYGIVVSYPAIVVLVATQVGVSCTALAPTGFLRLKRL